FHIYHLDIGHGTALVVVGGDGVSVGDDVVGGLDPVGVTLDLACSGVGRLVGAFGLDEDQGDAVRERAPVILEVDQVCFNPVTGHAFPHVEAQSGRLLF